MIYRVKDFLGEVGICQFRKPVDPPAALPKAAQVDMRNWFKVLPEKSLLRKAYGAAGVAMFQNNLELNWLWWPFLWFGLSTIVAHVYIHQVQERLLDQPKGVMEVALNRPKELNALGTQRGKSSDPSSGAWVTFVLPCLHGWLFASLAAQVIAWPSAPGG